MRMKRFWKEIMHIHYMNNMATPYHKNLCPRGHEMFTILVDPSLLLLLCIQFVVYMITRREKVI